MQDAKSDKGINQENSYVGGKKTVTASNDLQFHTWECFEATHGGMTLDELYSDSFNKKSSKDKNKQIQKKGVRSSGKQKILQLRSSIRCLLQAGFRN